MRWGDLRKSVGLFRVRLMVILQPTISFFCFILFLLLLFRFFFVFSAYTWNVGSFCDLVALGIWNETAFSDDWMFPIFYIAYTYINIICTSTIYVCIYKKSSRSTTKWIYIYIYLRFIYVCWWFCMGKRDSGWRWMV